MEKEIRVGTKKRFDVDFKAQILKEVRDTKNIALVARTHGLVYQTVVGWINSSRKAPEKKKERSLKEVESKLERVTLENRILKELLKKTNQVWLSEEQSQDSLSRRET